MVWLKRIGIGLLGLVVLLTVVGVLLPRRVHVQRSIDIAAPPANVFAVLNNLHVFNKWSPWADIDPETQYQFSGPWTGTGATMQWHSSNPKVGDGSETITASEPDRHIGLQMRFGAGRVAGSSFDLSPVADGTQVTWSFDVDFGWNLPARYTGLWFDRLIGSAYEAGLRNLQTFVNGLPASDLSGADIKLVTMQPQSIVYVSSTTTTDGRDVANAQAAAYAKVNAFIAGHQLKVTGAPMAVTRLWDPAHNRYEFDAAVPADWSNLTVPASSAVKLGQTLGGEVVVATYTGPYSGTSRTYAQIKTWLAANGLTATGLTWEQYLNDPANTPDDKLVTRIYTPVK